MLVRIIVILSFDPLCKQNRLLPVANWDIHAYVSVFIRQRKRFGLILGFYKYEYRFIVIHAPYICRGSLTRYDHAMRKFTGIDFMTEAVPDETTLCKFRHLLEENGLNKLFFDAINRVMVQTGHMMKGGTIVDATIINAPSSTKNAEKKRDPEMHQTKKGQ